MTLHQVCMGYCKGILQHNVFSILSIMLNKGELISMLAMTTQTFSFKLHTLLRYKKWRILKIFDLPPPKVLTSFLSATYCVLNILTRFMEGSF